MWAHIRAAGRTACRESLCANLIQSVIPSEARNLALGVFRAARDSSSPAVPLKVCQSERSEESALVRLVTELQILRFVQGDNDFHLSGWAEGPWRLGGMTGSSRFQKDFLSRAPTVDLPTCPLPTLFGHQTVCSLQ